MIRRSENSCKEGVRVIQCFPHTTRCCAYFSDYAHTSSIQGYLYSGGGGGGYVLSGHCNRQQISVKTEGYLISEGYLFTGFYGMSFSRFFFLKFYIFSSFSRLLFQPMTTSCGHTFCRTCLYRSLDRQASCPICRHNLSDIIAEQRNVRSCQNFNRKFVKL